MSHHVYFGESYEAVFAADESAPEYKGNQTGTSYALPADCDSFAPYFWRVDEVDADGKALAGALDISNNVVYNWWVRTTDGGIGKLNFVGNYYKMGAVSKDMAILQLNDDKLCDTPMQVYVSGNKVTDSKGNAKLSPSDDARKNGYADCTVYAAFDSRVETLPGMAQQLHISVSYLQKRYRQVFGIGFMEDLIAARIEKAKQLLTVTDRRVNEVAEQCGYQNPTHFMRQFKEKTGMTPSGFRRNTHAGDRCRVRIG